MNTPTKTCTKCGATYPATTEFFYAHSGCKHGVENRCKQCHIKHEENKRRAQGIPERFHELGDMVACSQCNTVYTWSSDNFITDKGKIVRMCKQCNRQRASDWQNLHPDRAKERKHRHYLKHRPELRPRNPLTPERVKEIRRNSRLRHPETEKAITHRRLARLRALPDTLTPDEWIFSQVFFSDCCAYCGNPPGFLPGMNITLDHIIPLASPYCTGTIASNCIPACQSCNASKGDRDIREWAIEKFGKHRAKQILKAISSYQSKCLTSSPHEHH